MGIIEEEADETIYWIELSIDADFINASGLLTYLSIVVSSIKTARTGRAE